MSRALALSTLLWLVACQTSRPISDDLRQNVPGEEQGHDHEVIAIVGTNDVHGALAPLDARTKDDAQIAHQRGGLAYLASYVSTLRAELGDRLLWLDGGDQYQGSLESNAEEGAPVVRIFNEMGLTAAAVGNHEFDFGPVGPEGAPGDLLGALKARMQEARYPYLAANIVEKKTGRMPDFPNAAPSRLFRAGRLNVGVIGLTTLDTPVTTRPHHVAHLDFTDLRAATLREAQALRKAGAHLVVITSHVGLQCDLGRNPFVSQVRKPSEVSGDCNPGDEMVRLLATLPPGTVDAVVAGHSHQVVHHWVAGVPVIQGGHRAQYFNIIYLAYDLTAGRPAPGRARIEGPISVCPREFSGLGHCNGDVPPPAKGRGELVAPTFHGRTIEADARIQTIIDEVSARTAELKRRVIARAERAIDHVRTGESELGNLVSDAIRLRTGADFALVNGGGLRAPLGAGDVTYGDLFRSLPFDNSVSLLKVTGRELRLILRVAESGSRGFAPVSGLKLRLIGLDHPAPSNDLDGDGKIAPWEVNRLLDVRGTDGSPIRDEKLYTLATIDFLASGGDDVGWAMKRIPKQRVTLDHSGMIRDVVEAYLSKAGRLNPADRPLIDPKQPRLALQKPPVHRGKKMGRRRR